MTLTIRLMMKDEQRALMMPPDTLVIAQRETPPCYHAACAPCRWSSCCNLEISCWRHTARYSHLYTRKSQHEIQLSSQYYDIIYIRCHLLSRITHDTGKLLVRVQYMHFCLFICSYLSDVFIMTSFQFRTINLIGVFLVRVWLSIALHYLKSTSAFWSLQNVYSRELSLNCLNTRLIIIRCNMVSLPVTYDWMHFFVEWHQCSWLELLRSYFKTRNTFCRTRSLSNATFSFLIMSWNSADFHWDMAIYRFSKWRPSASLELFYNHTTPPTTSLYLAAAACQISCQSGTQIWRYSCLNLSHNWLEMPIQVPKMGVLGDFGP